MSKKVGVGLIGARFISTIHARSLKHCPEAQLLAVASPTPGSAEAFARDHAIPHFYTDVQQMLALPEIDMVVIGAPNRVHCQLTVSAAQAGKHVVLEKPMCLNLREADEMIQACEKAGVKLMYAEEWNYGFHQEMAHFVDCVQNDKQPLVTGYDARAVLEVIFAAYQSSGSGRKVELPFVTDALKPIDLWKK